MDIRGPLHSSLSPAGYQHPRPAQRQINHSSQQTNDSQQQGQHTAQALPSLEEIEAAASQRSQPRFNNLDVDLSHPARQAIFYYQSMETINDPELMNRVDVYI